MKGWQRALGVFVVFNLVAVPLLGRLAWMAMEALNADGARFAAVLVSLAASVAILAGNVVVIRWATLGEMPRLGQMGLWIFTGTQFAVTIAAGFFSLVDFAWVLLGTG
ncbi:MAG: hypothetical protein AAF074_04905 [Pseudomonadota bacterium]